MDPRRNNIQRECQMAELRVAHENVLLGGRMMGEIFENSQIGMI